MPLEATFTCAACRGRAATLWLVLPGEADPAHAAIALGGPPVMDAAETLYDEAFLDGIRATSPRGHTRLVQD